MSRVTRPESVSWLRVSVEALIYPTGGTKHTPDFPMHCLVLTPHRLGIPEMAERVGAE
jgi:hypothetical protein